MFRVPFTLALVLACVLFGTLSCESPRTAERPAVESLPSEPRAESDTAEGETPLDLEPQTSATLPYRGVALLHLTDDHGARGYGTDECRSSLDRARGIGVDAISVRVPGRQPSIDDPRIRFGNEPQGEETDEVVAAVIRDAHERGMRVMLKPHIMLDRITEGEWRGRIDFADPVDLDEWWRNYRAFILNYAEFAERHRCEMYCIGVELMDMVVRAPDRWRELILDVRTVYTGHLTYAANWDAEYFLVPFWGELDFAAVQFFFPLSETPNPTQRELDRTVYAIADSLFRTAVDANVKLLLTECGYRSVRGSVVKPWVWPKDDPDAVADPELQARVYRSILTTFSSHPEFAGLFWWNWLTIAEPSPRLSATIFTPQGKPAESVVREAWTGGDASEDE